MGHKNIHERFFPLAAFVLAAALFAAGSAPATPEEADPFNDELPAKGKFLVAGRRLSDPRFQETVVLLISYGPGGATGLIINRPTTTPLAEMLPSMPSLRKRVDVVYYGGPVEGHLMLMLVRSDKKPEGSGHVFGNVHVSSSKNVLESMIAAHKTEKHFRVYSGYAGWSPGQLEREVRRGDWHILTAEARVIFEKKPSEIWRELIRRGSEIQVWRHSPRAAASVRKGRKA